MSIANKLLELDENLSVVNSYESERVISSFAVGDRLYLLEDSTIEILDDSFKRIDSIDLVYESKKEEKTSFTSISVDDESGSLIVADHEMIYSLDLTKKTTSSLINMSDYGININNAFKKDGSLYASGFYYNIEEGEYVYRLFELSPSEGEKRQIDVGIVGNTNEFTGIVTYLYNYNRNKVDSYISIHDYDYGLSTEETLELITGEQNIDLVIATDEYINFFKENEILLRVKETGIDFTNLPIIEPIKELFNDESAYYITPFINVSVLTYNSQAFDIEADPLMALVAYSPLDYIHRQNQDTVLSSLSGLLYEDIRESGNIEEETLNNIYSLLDSYSNVHNSSTPMAESFGSGETMFYYNLGDRSDSYYSFSSVEDFYSIYSYFGEDIAFTNLPGYSSPAISSNINIGITSMCDDLEGGRDILEYFLSYEAQSISPSRIPVNEDAFEDMLNNFRSRIEDDGLAYISELMGNHILSPGGQYVVNSYGNEFENVRDLEEMLPQGVRVCVEEEEITSVISLFESLVNGARDIRIKDSVIEGIVLEEYVNYAEGGIPMDDAISSTINRLQTYIAEQE